MLKVQDQPPPASIQTAGVSRSPNRQFVCVRTTDSVGVQKEGGSEARKTAVRATIRRETRKLSPCPPLRPDYYQAFTRLCSLPCHADGRDAYTR